MNLGNEGNKYALTIRRKCMLIQELILNIKSVCAQKVSNYGYEMLLGGL